MRSRITRLAPLAMLLALGCESTPEEPKKDYTRTAPPPKPAATATAPVVAKGPYPMSKHPALKDPSKATEQAPDTFRAKFVTSAGDFTVTCNRDWAPHGVDRFYNLVKIGFFQDVSFFRAIKNFVVQFGIHGDPAVSKVWKDENLPVDPPKESNTKGMLTYAMAGSPDTRSTQLFVNLTDNKSLDAQKFSPICKVDDNDMPAVLKIYTGHGSEAGGDQANIQNKGNKYLREKYPKLDYIEKVTIVGDDEPDGGGGGDGAAADDTAAAPDDTGAPPKGGDAPAPAPAPAPEAPHHL